MPCAPVTILLLATLDQSWACVRSWVPQLLLVRTFRLVLGKYSPDDHLETQDVKKCFFTLHKWWQRYFNFLVLQVKESKGARTFLTSLCHYTLTLYVYYREFLPINRPTLSPVWRFLKNLCTSHKTFCFQFPIWGGGSTSRGTIARNSRTTTFLLALGPREKKEVGYANNKFFLGRAALCTGGKVITLGRELQHTAQPDSWLGFPSIFLFVITNIL